MPRRSGSIRLVTVLGVRVGVSPSWFLVLFLLIYVLSSQFRESLDASNGVAFLTAVAAALLFFASVVAHELGHALAARREGIQTESIDLWFFGGLARLSREARTPGEEFRVAVAGPLLTLLVAVVCAGLGFALYGADATWNAGRFARGTNVVTELLAWLALVNIAVLALNLLPAYPLDGGRIARAVVWRFTGDKGKGTRAAAHVGRAFGWAIAAAGIALVFLGDLSGIWWVAMGFVIAGAARGALLQSAVQGRLEGLRVADVMDSEPVSVGHEWPLERAWDEAFARYRFPWFPVVDAVGRLVGLVREEQARPGGEASVASVMEASAPWQVPEDEPLEDLLGSEPLRRLGALVAVDDDGRLRGVVTLPQVRKAVAAAFDGPGARV